MQETRGRRLERGADRVVGGVCSGLAGLVSVDPLLVRLAFVLLTVVSGAGVVLYLLLWVLMPEPGEPAREGDVLGAGLRSVEADLRHIFGAGRRSLAATHGEAAAPAHRGGLWLGGLLIVLGAVLLAASAGLMAWWNWSVMWPVLLIGLGVLLMVRRLP